MKSLKDRMRNNYEKPGRIYLLKRVPVIIRIDGKSFHTYTKDFDKPFSKILMKMFKYACLDTIPYIQGFKLAYLQSDEVSLCLTDYDNITSEAWFDYNKSKLESISASVFSSFFNFNIKIYNDVFKLAFFDAKANNYTREEITNYFLWRAQDWKRNSLSMYTRSFFSHKELMNKNSNDMHEMLHSIGKNWSKDLSNREKNGLFIKKDNNNGELKLFDNILPTYENVNLLVEDFI